MSANKKMTVVVVGGGLAGASVVRPLSQSLNPALHELVLINDRPHAIPLPPALRLVSSPNNNLKETTFIPFDKIFVNGNGKFVQGEVIAIDAKEREVHLKNGGKVAFDVLVLATGNKWEGPLAFPQEPKEIDSFVEQRRNEFAAAKNILLVGGGAVGTELAGEIRDLWADKEITIVHREEHLLNSAYPTKVRKSLQKQLEARNIKVVLGESIPEDHVPGPQTDVSFPLKNGQTLHPDLVVRTWGGRPNTQWIASSLGQHSLSQRGHVKVKPTLQLLEHPNIFAAGDIIDWDEQKTSAKAGRGHAPVVVKNVVSFITGQQPTGEYKGSLEMILITNGKDAGVGYIGLLWGITFGAFLAKYMKSRHLLVSMIRGAYGY